MTHKNTCWLAGLLEGEGCFTVARRANGVYPRVCLAMSDQDVVSRAAALMQARPPTIERPRKPHYKNIARVEICGTKADALIPIIYPYMGSRRQSRMREVSTFTPLTDYPPVDVYLWLSGLLEGEGTFCLERDPRTVGSRNRIVCALRMTDRDVVARAAEIMKAPSVRRSIDKRENHSDVFTCKVSGVKAEEVMRAVLPFMGIRRTQRIEALLQEPNLSHHVKLPA